MRTFWCSAALTAGVLLAGCGDAAVVVEPAPLQLNRTTSSICEVYLRMPGAVPAGPATSRGARPVTTALNEECDTGGGGGDGGGGGGYTPPPPPDGIAIWGLSMNVCKDTLSWADADHDGLVDMCEEVLATHFAPLLSQEAAENPNGPRVGGEYYYGATLAANRTLIRLGYFPAYYRDKGYHPHPGDSEFIILDVSFNASTGRFLLDWAFLSAHCRAPSIGPYEADYDCRWWNWDRFAFADGIQRGAPVVWVANKKLANYYSQHKCNIGAYGIESCEGARRFVRFPVDAGFNIGHSGGFANGQNVGARRDPGVDVIDPNRTEDMWAQTGYFYGWQFDRSGEGATPYGQILKVFDFWWPSTSGPAPGCTSERYCRL